MFHRAPRLIGPLLLILASLAFSSYQVSRHHAYSPADEYIYIDYYAKVLDHGVVRQGEETGDFARRYASCHLNLGTGPVAPFRCEPDAVRPDWAYPFNGSTSADLYTPLYFYSVRLLAQPLIWSGTEFVQAGRYAGGVWLALGVVLLYLALLRLKVHRAIAFATSLILAGSLPAYWANTYLSTDATALAAGSGMLLLSLRYWDRPNWWRAAAMIVFAVVMTACKVQNLSAVVMAAIMLAVLVAREAGDGRRWSTLRRWLLDRRTVTGIVAVVAALAVQVAWLALRARLAVGPEVPLNVEVPFSFPGHIMLDMTTFFPGALQGAAPTSLIGIWPEVTLRITTVLVCAGTLGLLFLREAGSLARALVVAVLAAALLAGPALSLATLVLNGIYVPLPPRYGVNLVPGMLACVARAVPPGRAARIGYLALSAFLFAITFSFAEV